MSYLNIGELGEVMTRKTREVETHLSIQDLEYAYRNASSALVQRRAHVILLRARGIAPTRVAQLLCLTPSTISSYVRRFNELGLAFFEDARSKNGKAPMLDSQALELLERLLQSPPEDGGRWTGPKVTRWIEAHLGKPPNSLHNARGWETLKKLNYSYKSSRPRHVNAASEEEQQQWKKKSQ